MEANKAELIGLEDDSPMNKLGMVGFLRVTGSEGLMHTRCDLPSPQTLLREYRFEGSCLALRLSGSLEEKVEL